MALIDIIGAFGWDLNPAQIDAAQASLSRVLDVAQKLAPLAIAGTVGVGLAMLTKDVADFADEIADTSQKIGFSAEALQTWRYAAQINAVSAESLQGAIVRLNATIGKAATDATAGEPFKQLGVNLRDAAGNARTSEDIFGDTITALSGMTDRAARSGLALQVFGKSYGELNQLLDSGPEAINTLKREFVEAGGLIDGEFGEAAGHLNDSLDRMKASFLGVRVSIARAVLPAFQWVVDRGIKLGQGIAKIMAHSKATEAALVVLGAVAIKSLGGLALAARGALSALAPFAIPVLLIGGLFLLVEDLMTAFDGGKSVIAEWIDSFAGKGTFEAFISWVRQARADVEAFAEKIPSFADFIAGTDRAKASLAPLADVLRAYAPLLSAVAAGLIAVNAGNIAAAISAGAMLVPALWASVAAFVAQKVQALATAYINAGTVVMSWMAVAAAQLAAIATNPATYILIGVMALAAAITWLVQNWGSAWEKIRAGAQPVIDMIKNGIGWIQDRMGSVGKFFTGDWSDPERLKNPGRDVPKPGAAPTSAGTNNVKQENRNTINVNVSGAGNPTAVGDRVAAVGASAVDGANTKAMLAALRPSAAGVGR